jgi:ferredoxin
MWCKMQGMWCESWKTKRNVMQNARDVVWKLKNQAKCDAKCKRCRVKVEKPSKMWGHKMQGMSCESWENQAKCEVTKCKECHVKVEKTKQNVRSQNARNVMWKLRKPSKMRWKMQGDLSRYECWSKQWPLQNHFLNQLLISSANTNLRPTICNALTDFPLVSLALISAQRISTSLTLTNAYKLAFKIQNL